MSVPTAGTTKEYERPVVHGGTTGPRAVAEASAGSWSRGTRTAFTPRPQSIDRSAEIA